MVRALFHELTGCSRNSTGLALKSLKHFAWRISRTASAHFMNMFDFSRHPEHLGRSSSRAMSGELNGFTEWYHLAINRNLYDMALHIEVTFLILLSMLIPSKIHSLFLASYMCSWLESAIQLDTSTSKKIDNSTKALHVRVMTPSLFSRINAVEMLLKMSYAVVG